MPVIDTRVYLVCPAGRIPVIRARKARVGDFLTSLRVAGPLVDSGWSHYSLCASPATLVVAVDIAVQWEKLYGCGLSLNLGLLLVSGCWGLVVSLYSTGCWMQSSCC